LTIIRRIRRVARCPLTTCLLTLACSGSLALSRSAQAADTVPAPPASGSGGRFDVSTWPLIPVPEIGVDPDSGVTLGILPVWLHTNDEREITRIIAPDLLYNPNFGVGAHFRIFEYPSADERWSVVSFLQERVQRGVDLEYEQGRLRDSHWSLNTSLVFDRSGTARFYGYGNHSLSGAVTNYTATQLMAQAQAGFNLNPTWQLRYTLRARRMDITSGNLKHVPSIETRFPAVHGLGFTDEVLNQIAVVYDTRNDTTVPTQGTQWIAYAGLNSHDASLTDSIYSVMGLDARTFRPVLPDTILAAHAAIRYIPSGHKIPFFDLSAIGGDESDVGGQQSLRGFGQGRFVDRDSFALSVELRHRAFSFDAAATHVDIEVTPFVDLGRVASHPGVDPLSGLHKVVGVGVRGVARPSVVGYVDAGYGTEGLAVFTGINYPF
jgi:Omp85 superfamily domain